MSDTIRVIICPKDELGFDSATIRERFNDLSGILNENKCTITRYLETVDIASGEMPADNLNALKTALDPHGFSVDTKKTLYPSAD